MNLIGRRLQLAASISNGDSLRTETLKEDRDRPLWCTGSFSSAKVRMNFADNNGLFFASLMPAVFNVLYNTVFFCVLSLLKVNILFLLLLLCFYSSLLVGLTRFIIQFSVAACNLNISKTCAFFCVVSR